MFNPETLERLNHALLAEKGVRRFKSDHPEEKSGMIMDDTKVNVDRLIIGTRMAIKALVKDISTIWIEDQDGRLRKIFNEDGAEEAMDIVSKYYSK